MIILDVFYGSKHKRKVYGNSACKFQSLLKELKKWSLPLRWGSRHLFIGFIHLVSTFIEYYESGLLVNSPVPIGYSSYLISVWGKTGKYRRDLTREVI